jgi:hypothetical protein
MRFCIFDTSAPYEAMLARCKDDEMAPSVDLYFAEPAIPKKSLNPEFSLKRGVPAIGEWARSHSTDDVEYQSVN